MIRRALATLPIVLVGTIGWVVVLAGSLYLLGGSFLPAVSALPQLLVAAVTLAFAMRTVAVVRRPVASVVHLCVGVLLVVAVLISALPLQHVAARLPLPPPQLVTPFEERTVYYGSEFAMHITERSGTIAYGTVLRPRASMPGGERTASRLRWYEETYVDPVAGVLVVPDAGSVPLSAFDVVGRGGLPGPLTSIAADLERWAAVVQAEMSDAPRTALPMLSRAVPLISGLLATALAVAIAGLWTAARLTRWPLANLLLVAAYLRMLLVLPRLVVLLPEAVIESVPHPEILSAAAIGVASLIVALLLPPLARWQRELDTMGRAS